MLPKISSARTRVKSQSKMAARSLNNAIAKEISKEIDEFYEKLVVFKGKMFHKSWQCKTYLRSLRYLRSKL